MSRAARDNQQRSGLRSNLLVAQPLGSGALENNLELVAVLPAGATLFGRMRLVESPGPRYALRGISPHDVYEVEFADGATTTAKWPFMR